MSAVWGGFDGLAQNVTLVRLVEPELVYLVLRIDREDGSMAVHDDTKVSIPQTFPTWVRLTMDLASRTLHGFTFRLWNDGPREQTSKVPALQAGILGVHTAFYVNVSDAVTPTPTPPAVTKMRAGLRRFLPHQRPPSQAQSSP